MDIRLFRCRCFVFLGLWVGYEAKDGNQKSQSGFEERNARGERILTN